MTDTKTGVPRLDPATLRWVAAELKAKCSQIEQTENWHTGLGHMKILARDYFKLADTEAEKAQPSVEADDE